MSRTEHLKRVTCADCKLQDRFGNVQICIFDGEEIEDIHAEHHCPRHLSRIGRLRS